MKLSIVTINYNNKAGLLKTIESVLSQTYQHFEYIIIDGGSKDGSADIIQQNAEKITYWVSEKDAGIYDAMNKGIAVARGEYLLMLNSGDFLVNNKVLERVFKTDFHHDIVFGDLLWDENGKTFPQTFPNKLSFKFFKNHSLGHPCTFIRRSLHQSVGLYDVTMKIAADWKFFTTAICKHNASYLHIPELISVCDRDGISCDPANGDLIEREKNSLFVSEFSLFINDYDAAERAFQELNLIKGGRFYKLYDFYRKIRKRKSDNTEVEK